MLRHRLLILKLFPKKEKEEVMEAFNAFVKKNRVEY